MFLAQWQIDYYTGRKTELLANLALVNTRIGEVLGNTVKQYSLSTGQTSQQVTRMSLGELEAYRGRLESELLLVLGYLNCDAKTVYVRPGF